MSKIRKDLEDLSQEILVKNDMLKLLVNLIEIATNCGIVVFS